MCVQIEYDSNRSTITIYTVREASCLIDKHDEIYKRAHFFIVLIIIKDDQIARSWIPFFANQRLE